MIFSAELPDGFVAPAAFLVAAPEDRAVCIAVGTAAWVRGRAEAASAAADDAARALLEHRAAELAAQRTAELRAALAAATANETSLDISRANAAAAEARGRAAEERAAAAEERAATALAAAAQKTEEAVLAAIAAATSERERERASAAAQLEDTKKALAALERALADARATAEAAAARDTRIAAELGDLSAQFTRVFASGGASSDKGRAGELALGALLLDLFPDAELHDCSSVAGAGDAVIVLTRGGRRLRFLIESKNVARIRADDVSKFVRDVAARLNGPAADHVDGALFCALVADGIPHQRGPVEFVQIGADGLQRVPESTCPDTPVLPAIYVTRALAEPERLRLGIEALAYAAAAAAGAAEDDEPAEPAEALSDVAEAVSIAFGVLSRQSARLRALRESAAAIVAALGEFEGESGIAVAAINALWTVRPALRRDPAAAAVGSPGAGGVDPAASAAIVLRRFIDQHGRDPRRDEAIAAGVPDAVLRRAGGVRVLIQRAKQIIK